jgi:hypothetical protein
MSNMRITKEFTKAETTGRYYMLIRTNCYTGNLQHLFYLTSIAQEDFLDLKLSEISVVQYGGRRFSGTFGIEWENCHRPPESYAEIDQMPPTR